MSLLFSFWLLFYPDVSFGQSLYSSTNRINKSTQILNAFDATDPQIIKNIREFVSLSYRTTCISDYHKLKVSCLKEATKRSCQQLRGKENVNNCLLISDIVVVNKLGELNFVSSRKKYDIMKKHKNFKRHLNMSLENQYSLIVAELLVDEDFDCTDVDNNCLGERTSSFCNRYSQGNSLSWQHCVSAILWHIGSNRKKL